MWRWELTGLQSTATEYSDLLSDLNAFVFLLKIKILWSLYHHLVPTLYDFPSFVKEKILTAVHTMDDNYNVNYKALVIVLIL